MTSTTTPTDHAEIARLLDQAGQRHLLAFAESLDDAGRARLFDRISALDPARLAALAHAALDAHGVESLPDDIAPAPYYPRNPDSADRRWDRDRHRAIGVELLRAGAVAVFTVAGGQGTRLGYDGPKGCFPAGAVTGKPLFQILAEQVRAASIKYSATIPWRIMTSPLNHDATAAFFRKHNNFDLEPSQIDFFPQGVLPSFDAKTGKILLAADDEPATNPDGHGGSLRALAESGALDDLQNRGVAHLSYTQIDNPLVNAIDPVFLGLHAAAPDSSAEMSSKMIAKTEPAEKVGVFCRSAGRTRVIEYSDLPMELAHARDSLGRLRFNAGSPAIHVIALGFIRRLNDAPGGFALPLHRAKKIVPFINPATGARTDPVEPNAIKLETFVFDALPMCERSIVLETDRSEFAPIKNSTGADSPESCRRLQTERAAAWLESAGVRVPRHPDGTPDCTIELSPLTSLEPADLRNADIPASIEPGARVAV